MAQIAQLSHGVKSICQEGAPGQKRIKATTRLAYTLFPAHVWSTLRLEWGFTRARLANYWISRRRRSIKDLVRIEGLKIHLGCGTRTMAGWVNVDGMNRDGVDLVWDLRKPLPFKSSSVQMIYSEHCLEHLFEEDALNLLKESRRILKPAGVLRLGVPDAELYLRNYADGKTDFFQQLQHLGGAVRPLSTPIMVINQMFRMGGHHLYAWDYETLSLCLQLSGFVDVKRFESGASDRSDICLDDPAHAFETLYVEAQKPLSQ
jgi:predicted SAM-dependent methyltransferase